MIFFDTWTKLFQLNVIILKCNLLKNKVFSWFDFCFPTSCLADSAMHWSGNSGAKYREVGLSLEYKWRFSIKWTHSFLCITLTDKIAQWILRCEFTIIYCLWKLILQSACSHPIPYKRWTWTVVCFLRESLIHEFYMLLEAEVRKYKMRGKLYAFSNNED